MKLSELAGRLETLGATVLAVHGGHGDVAREAAAALREAEAVLREFSNLYAHVWDRADGAICLLSESSIERFEKAHERIRALLGEPKAD